MANNLWNLIDNVSYTKKWDQYSSSEVDTLYVPYIVNKSLSYHADSLIYANELNQRAFIDKDLQYSFYLNTLRSRKRFSKWAKREDSEKLKIVMELFNYSPDKANQVLDLISDEQIKQLMHHRERCTGGVE